MTATAQLLEDSLLVIWNDRNAGNRLEAMKNVYTADIHFYENNAGEPIVGTEAINDRITELQARWPESFQFELNRPSQVNHHIQMISWNLGPQGVSPAATGRDVAVIQDNRIQALYLFLDAPEPATGTEK